jgi:outer membrane protein TolC
MYQARTTLLPVLSVNALYTRLSQEPLSVDFRTFTLPGADVPRIFGNPLLQYAHRDNYSAFFRVNQPLYTGGRNTALLRSSQAEYRLRVAQLAAARDRLRADMVRSFYGVILAQEMKKLSEEVLRQLQDHLDLVGKLKRGGAATDYDYLRTQAQLASWKPRLARAERDLKNAVRGLNMLRGEDPGAPLLLRGELSLEECRELPPIESALQNAREKRPELAGARESGDISRNARSVHRSEGLPQLNLQYNYNFYDKEANLSFEENAWQTWWDLRAMLSWEVFAFGRHRARTREGDLEVEQRNIDINALADRITSEVEDSFDALAEARASVDAGEENVRAAEQAYHLAEQSYRSGTMTNVDVLDSYVSLTDARTQHLKALYDYKVTCAEFERATVLHQ